MQPKISGLSKSSKIQLILQDLLDEANIHFLRQRRFLKVLIKKK